MPCQQAACRHGSNSAARRGQTGHGSVGTGGAEQERVGPEIGKRASMQLEDYKTPSPASTERKPGDAHDNTAADGITECLRPLFPNPLFPKGLCNNQLQRYPL